MTTIDIIEGVVAGVVATGVVNLVRIAWHNYRAPSVTAECDRCDTGAE